MEHEQPYRDPEIRLADVAVALDVSPHVLSQTINELAGVKLLRPDEQVPGRGG